VFAAVAWIRTTGNETCMLHHGNEGLFSASHWTRSQSICAKFIHGLCGRAAKSMKRFWRRRKKSYREGKNERPVFRLGHRNCQKRWGATRAGVIDRSRFGFRRRHANSPIGCVCEITRGIGRAKFRVFSFSGAAPLSPEVALAFAGRQAWPYHARLRFDGNSPVITAGQL